MKIWIARDENGSLSAYNVEPTRYIRGKGKGYGFFNVIPGMNNILKLDDSLFPEVTWENSPQKVKIELLKR